MPGVALGAVAATVWYAVLVVGVLVLLVLAIRGNWFVRINTFLSEVRAELNRIVELLEGIIRDDQRRERDEPSTPQLAAFQRPLAKQTENGG